MSVQGQASSIVEASLRDGWETFKQNWAMLYGLAVVYILLASIVSLPGSMMNGSEGPGPLYLLLQILSFVVQIVVGTGISMAVLAMLRTNGGRSGLDAILSAVERAIPLVLATIGQAILVGIGFILLIIPGIILGLGLSQTQLLIVDRGLGAVEALQASWEIMRGYKLQLLILGLVSFLIVIAGALALGVGLLIALPVTAVAPIAFYNRLPKGAPSSNAM